MFYYKLLLDLFFYGLIVFAIFYVVKEIHDYIIRHRRNIRRSMRIIRIWYHA